jgi:hypothetical protein
MLNEVEREALNSDFSRVEQCYSAQ